MAKNHSVTKRNRRNVGKTRVKASRERIQRTSATLAGATLTKVGHHCVSHDGPCPRGCYFETVERVYGEEESL